MRYVSPTRLWVMLEERPRGYEGIDGMRVEKIVT
jgi:hypothetical protein